MSHSHERLNYLLECLAVVDDGNHVLNITLRKLPVSQVILFVDHHLLSVSITDTHTHTQSNGSYFHFKVGTHQPDDWPPVSM